MKTKMKLILGMLTATLATSALSAKADYEVVDGAIQLPEFVVVASSSTSTAPSSVVADETWQYEKSLDYQSEPLVVSVLGLENEQVEVTIPKIEVALVDQHSKRG